MSLPGTDSHGNLYLPAGLSLAVIPTISGNQTKVLVPGLNGKISIATIDQLTQHETGISVSSVFGRSGDIIGQVGDYTTNLILENGNLYYTNARARAALAVTNIGVAGPASYDNISGILNIPNYQFVPLNRTITINGQSADLSADRTFYIDPGVTSFNTRIGAISLTSLDVTSALGFTPLSSVSFTETDPTVPAYVKGITTTDISHWSNAYSWGNHALAGYITSFVESDPTVASYIKNINSAQITSWDLAASWGNHAVANYVPQARTITINGTTYDLTANRTWTINPMVYPATGIALSTGTAWGSSITNNSANWNTAYGWGNHASAGYATTTYVGIQIANLVASAPSTLDTLNELAAALGNDANFATTVATSIGTKQAQLNGTGFVKVSGTTVSYDNSTYVNTTSNQTITGIKTFSSMPILSAASSVDGQIVYANASNQLKTITNFKYDDATGVLTTQIGNLGSNAYTSTAYQPLLTNPVTGTGTTNYLPKFTGTSTIGNSAITDDGTTVTLVSRALSGTSATFTGNVFLGSASVTAPNNIVLGMTNGVNIQSRIAVGVPQLAISTNIDGDWYAPTYKVSNYAAQIYIDGNQGTIGLRTAPTGTAGGAITWNTPAIYIANNSNVGIGTTSPQVLLQLGEGSLSNSTINQFLRVNSGTYNALSYAHLDLFNFGNNFGNALGWRVTSGTESVGVSVGRFLSFNTVVTDGSGNPSSTTERARFSSGGNLLVGTTTDAGYKLDVNGTGRFNGALTVGTSQAIITPTNFGYSSIYKVLAIGTGASNTNVSLNYDPSGNASGSFNGTGQILIAHNKGILAPNATNNDFIAVLRPISTGVYFGGGMSSGEVVGNGLFISTTGAATFSSSVNANAYGLAGVADAITWTTNTLRLGQGSYWNNIELWDGSAIRLKVASGGNVLIGTTTDNGNKLQVDGGIYSTYTIASVSSANVDLFVFSAQAATYTHACFVGNTAQAAATNAYFFYGQVSNTTATIKITTNGNIVNTNGSYGTISDIKIKRNIVDTSPKLENLLKVRVVNYNLIDKYEQHKQLGVIAQEVEKIFPNMVEDTFDKNTGEVIKSVKYSVFVPMLIKGMQEQQEQIEDLKKQIEYIVENK